MKKSVVILGIVFAATLAGCTDEGVVDGSEMVFEQGVLEKQQNGDQYNGSHLLVDGEEVLALRSTNLNLSSSEYLGNKIQVVGVYDEGDEVFEVTGVSVMEILEPAEVAGFVSYKNVEQGFEVRYYEDWELNERQNGDVEFTNPVTSSTVSVTNYAFDYSPTLDEEGNSDTALGAFFAERFNGEEVGTTFKVGVNGLNAARRSDDDAVEVYYLYRNGLIYEISFSDYRINEDKLVFNEMLASFKFTGFKVENDATVEEVDAEEAVEEEVGLEPKEAFNPMDLPSIDMEFSSFASIPYHFSASYPASWYYAGAIGSGNVLHHYGVRAEADEDSPELIGLDVVKEIPAGGQKIKVGKLNGTKFVANGEISIYVEVADQRYRVSGSEDYENIILVMAGSIKAIEE